MLELIPPTIVILIATTIGDFGNYSIIWATIRNKNLRGPCNILIAFNALSDSMAQIGSYILAYYLFSGTVSTTRMTCYFLQLIPSFGVACGLCFTLAIGIDRLIGIAKPSMYRSLNPIHYIGTFVILAYLYAGELAYFNYQGNILNASDTIVCFTSTIVHPSVYEMRNYQQGILCSLVLIVYALIWICIWKKKSELDSMKRIMKPLTVIMLIVIVTWPVMVVTFALIRKLAPPENSLQSSLYISSVFYFGVSSHYFVFLIFSKDYKQAFLRQLSCFLCVKNSRTSPVVTMAVTKSSTLMNRPTKKNMYISTNV